MDTPEFRPQAEPSRGYALSGKIMLSAIIILFAVVVFMVGLHLYARWYLVRLRRRQIERRRQRRSGRTHVVLYADNRNAAADRGLALTVINSLPYFMYSSKSEQPPLECAVCLSEFEEKEIVRLLPKCNHNFHLECIDMWFLSHSTCPLCRSAVEAVPEQLGPVEEGNETEPGSSSRPGSEPGLCPTCHHEEASVNENNNHNNTTNENGNTSSLGDRRKGLEVRIEVPPRSNDLTQCSPASRRLLSLKRILSMGRRSPISGGATTPSGAGPSGSATELDLESGPSEVTREPSRFQTTV